MQPISSDALSDLLSGHKVDIRISCEGVDSSIVILDEDIIDGSFSIDRNSVSGEVIEIGNAETTEVKFSLNNVDHRFDSFKFEGAVLTIDLYVSTQQIRLGKFIVDKRPGKRNAISIIALDYMAKFNKPYYTSLTDGATLFEMLQDCCASCNVTLYEDSITNGSVPCLIPTDETTFHEVVSLIAELSGSNAWVDWNGELRLSWYGENQSSVLNITDEVRYSYSAAENDILITGILYKLDEEYLAGTDDYALVIEENPLVDITNIATILSSIYAKVGGFIYRPFSLSSSGLPHLWPMDAVDLTADSTIRSYVTNHKYILNGLSDIQAKGESESTYSYASAAPFTTRQKSVLNKVIDIRAGQQITALDKAMIQLNELAANAQGFYQTTVTDPVTSARIDYMHNQQLLVNSTIVYKRTIDGFFWTDNYQGDSTVWTSGYTASGNIVAKTLSAVGINADWVNAGSVTSSNHTGTGDGSAFSTAGMKINLNDGTISAPKFRISSDGTAEFSGKIDATSGYLGGFTITSTYIKGGDLYLNTSGQISIYNEAAGFGFNVSSIGHLTAKAPEFTNPKLINAQACSFGISGATTIDVLGQISSTHGATFGDVVIGSSGTITMDGQLYVGGTTSYCTISGTGAIMTKTSLSVATTGSFAGGAMTIGPTGNMATTGSFKAGDAVDYCSISSIGTVITTSSLTVGGNANLNGTTNTIAGSLKHTGANAGFFNTTPTYARTVSAPSTITTTGTADATYSSNEQTMLGNLKTDVTNLRTTLNNIWTALNAYGLV